MSYMVHIKIDKMDKMSSTVFLIYFNEYYLAGVMIKSPDDELIQFESYRLFIDISMY
jgi:hypothetical protein